MRRGLEASGGISYRIRNQNAPNLYAPRPISNKLESRPSSDKNLGKVRIWDYARGSGNTINIDDGPSREITFTAIDLDVWGREFLSAFDSMLSPEFSRLAAIVGNYFDKTNYNARLLEIKKSLAASIARMVIPVLQGESYTQTEITAAQEAFEQQLLIALSNCYAIDGVIQFQADVTAAFEQPQGVNQPPRLYGKPQQIGTSDPDVALTSANLRLKTTTNDPALLTFVLYSTPCSRNGFIRLNLEFQATDINLSIEENKASSWLTFIVPNIEALTQPLGEFNVPLPIRASPVPPTMVNQEFEASSAKIEPEMVRLSNPSKFTGGLKDALRWDYLLTYVKPYSYPKDRTYLSVEFNVEEEAESLPEALEGSDLFSALAEFVTIWPSIKQDLCFSLKAIDCSTDPTSTEGKQHFKIAKAALESFIAVTARIDDAWNGEAADGKQVKLEALESDRYEFYIEEHEKTAQNRMGTGEDVPEGALCLHLVGKPSASLNIGAPNVEICHWTAERTEVIDGYIFTYSQGEGDKKTFLLAAEAAKIANRQVVLPNLYILGKQDAWASAHFRRNEQLLPLGEPPTAEPFVYRTAECRFANPLHPMIESSDPLPVQCIGSTQPKADSGCDDPQTRPLDEHLSALFTDLFTGYPKKTMTIQMEVQYGYVVQAQINPVGRPILLLPPTEFNVIEDAKTCAENADSLVCQLTNAIKAWFTANTPSTPEGILRFDLTVFTTRTQQPLPLLQLTNIELPWEYIRDPTQP